MRGLVSSRAALKAMGGLRGLTSKASSRLLNKLADASAAAKRGGIAMANNGRKVAKRAADGARMRLKSMQQIKSASINSTSNTIRRSRVLFGSKRKARQQKARDRKRAQEEDELYGSDLITLYRVETNNPAINQRLDLIDDNTIELLPPANRRDPAVHISVGNYERALHFKSMRDRMNSPDETHIKSFQVERRVVEKITRNSIRQEDGGFEALPGRPLSVDNGVSIGQYAFHPDDMQTLLDNIIEGSVRTIEMSIQ